MRALFLCEGTTVPASRFRVGQFIEPFERAGLSCEVRYGYGDRYNELVGTRWAAPYKLASRLKRIPYAADADEFDIVFVQRPALPQSSMPERLLNWLNPRTVFDFDDSLIFGPDLLPDDRRERVFREIVDMCREVVAGNEFLARSGHAPQKTTVIPTVIDTERYVPARDKTPGRVVGWMGTAGNFGMLRRIAPMLRRLHDTRDDVTIRIVSNAAFEPLLGLERVEQIRWQRDLELELLQSFDVGLMPLEDTDVSRGKCAFKMIQYMAVGIPVVVSAVEANIDVLGDVDAGRAMPDFAGWEEVILEMLDDQRGSRERGAAGRERVEAHYSVTSVVPRYLEIFERVARR